MKRAILGIFCLAALFVAGAGAQNSAGGDALKEERVKIAIRIGGGRLTATMEDNPTARAFVSRLPLTLRLSDYAGTEKISSLPEKLTTAEAPDGIDPSVGDLAYYAPWGNIALFYKDFGYSSGLVLLGRLDSGIEVIKAGGSLQATFEELK